MMSQDLTGDNFVVYRFACGIELALKKLQSEPLNDQFQYQLHRLLRGRATNRSAYQ
jgi:hypothetical protein